MTIVQIQFIQQVSPSIHQSVNYILFRTSTLHLRCQLKCIYVHWGWLVAHSACELTTPTNVGSTCDMYLLHDCQYMPTSLDPTTVQPVDSDHSRKNKMWFCDTSDLLYAIPSALSTWQTFRCCIYVVVVIGGKIWQINTKASFVVELMDWWQQETVDRLRILCHIWRRYNIGTA